MTNPRSENDSSSTKRSNKVRLILGVVILGVVMLGALVLYFLVQFTSTTPKTHAGVVEEELEAPAEEAHKGPLTDGVAAPRGPVQPLTGPQSSIRKSSEDTPSSLIPTDPELSGARGQVLEGSTKRGTPEKEVEKKEKKRKKKGVEQEEEEEEGEIVTAESDGHDLGSRGAGSGGGGHGSGRLHGTGKIATGTVKNDASPEPPTKKTSVSCYPVMEARPRVRVGVPFPLKVWLQEELGDANVKVTNLKEGMTSDGDGKVTITVDALEDGKRWTFYVSLRAPGFKFKKKRKKITLGHPGDSTKAVFQLEARPIDTEEKRYTVTAMLWSKSHDHLGSFKREIVVEDRNHSSGDMVANVVKSPHPVSIRPPGKGADLTVLITYKDPRKLGAATMSIVALGDIQDGDFHTNPELAEWLQRLYKDIHSLRKSSKTKRITIATLNGIGEKLYDQLAPELFKKKLRLLLKHKSVKTIQFKTNSTLIPWELMRPVHPKTGKRLDFLGVEFAVARLHKDERYQENANFRDELPLQSLTAIAPHYRGSRKLPQQARELAALQKVPGFRRIQGRYDALKTFLASSPSGVIHFAGHGHAKKRSGNTQYSISLEDEEITQALWDDLVPEMIKEHPFFFFNACDVGDAQSTAGFVEGWAPTVLNAGASGYIGGLWPLGDKAAADAAQRFYGHISDKLSDGPVPVAQVLQTIRKRFYETGDPTYLAYVYYGRVNLKFTK